MNNSKELESIVYLVETAKKLKQSNPSISDKLYHSICSSIDDYLNKYKHKLSLKNFIHIKSMKYVGNRQSSNKLISLNEMQVNSLLKLINELGLDIGDFLDEETFYIIASRYGNKIAAKRKREPELFQKKKLTKPNESLPLDMLLEVVNQFADKIKLDAENKTAQLKDRKIMTAELYTLWSLYNQLDNLSRQKPFNTDIDFINRTLNHIKKIYNGEEKEWMFFNYYLKVTDATSYSNPLKTVKMALPISQLDILPKNKQLMSTLRSWVKPMIKVSLTKTEKDALLTYSHSSSKKIQIVSENPENYKTTDKEFYDIVQTMINTGKKLKPLPVGCFLYQGIKTTDFFKFQQLKKGDVLEQKRIVSSSASVTVGLHFARKALIRYEILDNNLKGIPIFTNDTSFFPAEQEIILLPPYKVYIKSIVRKSFYGGGLRYASPINGWTGEIWFIDARIGLTQKEQLLHKLPEEYKELFLKVIKTIMKQRTISKERAEQFTDKLFVLDDSDMNISDKLEALKDLEQEINEIIMKTNKQ